MLLAPLGEMSAGRWALTPSELKQRLKQERAGRPFIELRDADGELRFQVLPGHGAVSVGRDEDADLSLTFDPEVSRLHAELHRIGRYWVISDDGLSRNGTFVNGTRVAGRHRLHDGDTIEVGGSTLVYRDPARASTAGTAPPSPRVSRPTVSAAQRRVLVALCRPFASGQAAMPASNQAIADELHLSVSAVKAHLRALFSLFSLDQAPQNEKRVRLATAALRSGIVAPRDLED